MEITKELVIKAKKGDAVAFSEIYSLIYKDMYRYAYYVLGNQQDAEDVVSEATIDAYKDIKKLRDEGLFKNWIFKILSNKCKRKKKSYIQKTLELDENLEATGIDYDEKYDVRNAFKILSDEEKNVVGMAVFAGYKSHEIADSLKLNPNTVRSKLSRALLKMQQYLEIGGAYVE